SAIQVAQIRVKRRAAERAHTCWGPRAVVARGEPSSAEPTGAPSGGSGPHGRRRSVEGFSAGSLVRLSHPGSHRQTDQQTLGADQARNDLAPRLSAVGDQELVAALAHLARGFGDVVDVEL